LEEVLLRRIYRSALFPAIVLFTALLTGPAPGAELTLVPSITVREEVNDNIFFSVDGRKSSFISTASPGLDFIGRTERLDASLLTRLDARVYTGNSDLNAVDQSYQGKFRYRGSERLTLSADGLFSSDNRPDRDVETTGLVTNSVRRNRITWSAGADYLLTDKTMTSISYNYGHDDYKSQRFSDLVYHTANVSMNYDLGRFWSSTKALANLRYDRYLFSGSTVDNYSVTVGVTQDVSEKWNFLIVGGGTLTRSETFFPYTAGTDRGWGWTGRGTLTYRGEKTSGNLTFSHDVSPSTGRNVSQATRRTALTADGRWRFTQELSGGFYAGYYMNKSVQGGLSATKIDEDSLYASPSLRYDFNRDMSLETAYQYTRVLYSNLNQTADRNLFFVRFVYRMPVEF
jgi:hypothetical protein